MDNKNELERLVCGCCGAELDTEDYYEMQGELLCPNCNHNETVACEHCGERIWLDDNAGSDNIKDEWLDIQEMSVDIVIIDTPILNTKEKSDLERNLICSIVFELLAYTAEKERRKIRTRQAEGIKLALDRGVKFGRPETALPENYAEVIGLWRSGSITAVEAMRRLGIKKTTFYKLAGRQTNK